MGDRTASSGTKYKAYRWQRHKADLRRRLRVRSGLRSQRDRCSSNIQAATTTTLRAAWQAWQLAALFAAARVVYGAPIASAPAWVGFVLALPAASLAAVVAHQQWLAARRLALVASPLLAPAACVLLWGLQQMAAEQQQQGSKCMCAAAVLAVSAALGLAEATGCSSQASTRIVAVPAPCIAAAVAMLQPSWTLVVAALAVSAAAAAACRRASRCSSCSASVRIAALCIDSIVTPTALAAAACAAVWAAAAAMQQDVWLAAPAVLAVCGRGSKVLCVPCVVLLLASLPRAAEAMQPAAAAAAAGTLMAAAATTVA
jgi:hypothetical protein